MIDTATRESRMMLRLVSLMLALLIWFQMSGRVAESERIQTRSYRPILEYVTAPGEDIEPKSENLMVAVTISGPDQALQNLREQDLSVEVDLSGLTAGGSFEMPLTPGSVKLPKDLEGVVAVERIVPQSVRVELVAMESKTLDVLAFPQGSPASNYRLVGDIRVIPPRVRVRGPKRVVADLEHLITDVDISGWDKTTTGTLQFRPDELPKDTAIENLGGITYTAVIQEIEETRVLDGDWPIVLEDQNWILENPERRVSVSISGPISALPLVDPAWIKVRANTRIPDPLIEETPQPDPSPSPDQGPADPNKRSVPLIAGLEIPDDFIYEDPVIMDKIAKVRLQCAPGEVQIKKQR